MHFSIPQFITGALLSVTITLAVRWGMKMQRPDA